MFSLAFLECFTIVVFIEVKVIQFLVFSVVQNCICYVFYSVCLVFGLSSFLALSQSIECKFFTIRQCLWRHSDCVKFYNSNNILITSSNFSFLPRVSPLIIFEEGHLVPSFVVLLTLYYRSVVVWKTSHHWLIYIQITNRDRIHKWVWLKPEMYKRGVNNENYVI